MAEKKTNTKVDLGVPELRTRSEREMAFLVEKYFEKHPDEVQATGSVDPDRLVDWAFETGLYRAKPISPKAQLRRRLRRHLGHRHLHDNQGRTPRALIAVPTEELTEDGIKSVFKYYPLHTTDPEKIRVGLQLRRGWAFKRVEQIETDRLSYNDNNPFGAVINQLEFNFDKQLAQSQMPTTYPTSAPEDFEDDDDRPTE